MKKAIILFTRAPLPGKTKTRMMPELSPKARARLHACFLKDIGRETEKTGADLFICYTPVGKEEILRPLLPARASYFPQEGDGLGERMHRAFCRVFEKGYDACLLLGSDVPEVQAEDLKQAFSLLEHHDVVLGPTTDGGYYLAGMKKPVLVSGTDGVGTKLKLAFLIDKHDTVGIDCVAMCVNDIVCGGAAPMFFLDYIACGKNHPARIADIVSGITEGCRQAECALVGGETAEMPGFYPVDEYDLAGFSVGIVDEEKIIDGKKLAAGDVLVGLASSGVHSNGFSLVRKVLDVEHADLKTPREDLNGKSLGEALLAPTRIYVKAVKALLKAGVDVHAVSHITGGGFYENIPRCLKKGCAARIAKENVRTPALFHHIQTAGNIPERDMFNTFNMGVGMTITVAKADADAALALLREGGEPGAYILGEIVPGEGGVELW